MVTICILLIIEEFTSLSRKHAVMLVIEYLFTTLIVFPGLLPIYVPLIYIRAFSKRMKVIKVGFTKLYGSE